MLSRFFMNHIPATKRADFPRAENRLQANSGDSTSMGAGHECPRALYTWIKTNRIKRSRYLKKPQGLIRRICLPVINWAG